jgi:hypothetical protein
MCSAAATGSGLVLINPTPDAAEASSLRRARYAERSAELLEPVRRDLAEGILDDAGELVPVNAVVQENAEPAAMPDVRRPEESLRSRGDEQLLVAGRRGAPDRKVAVPVVVVQEHQETLLVAHEEARSSVTRPLARLGQPEADPAQPLENGLPLGLARIAHVYRVPRPGG